MKEKLYDIISRTAIELGHKTDGKTLAVLSKTFAYDLETDKRFRRLTIEDVDIAFRLGVRLDEKDSFLNIRTFYSWCLAHKKCQIITLDEIIKYLEKYYKKKYSENNK